MKYLAWFVALVGWPAILLAGAWFLILPMLPAKPASEVSVPAKEAPAAKRAGKAKVVPKKPVTVYGPSAPARLKLPADVKPTEPVIAATQVRASERSLTVTTVLDTETGESRSFVKQDEYPWLAVEHRGEARLSYGYKHSGWQSQPVARLSVGYDVLRVKAFTAGVGGQIDSDGDAFVGLGIAYRW